MTASECSQIPSTNTAELRNNEACVALRRREYHRAAVLFNQSLRAAAETAHAGMFRLSLGKTGRPTGAVDGAFVSVRHGEMAANAVCGRLYNAGLALLKLSKPVDAFRHFSAALASSLAERPHIWLRLADCCLLSCSSAAKCGAHVASGVPSVESVALGKSRRIYLK